MIAEEFHDYLERQNSSRSKKYMLSVDSEGRSTGIWLKEKSTAYRLTVEAFSAGVAEHITLSEFKGEGGWDIFNWSHGEEIPETDPELFKLLDAAKAKNENSPGESKSLTIPKRSLTR